MKRALLAEDDPVNRAFLCEALALSGWEVEAFERGESAAEAAIARPFEVLILDLNLPGADGIATLRRIRNRDDHASADAPALALTADPRPELHQHLRQQGFDAVASKPLTLARLDAILQALVGPTPAQAPTLEDASHAPEALPIWDDADALASLGGQVEILAALRRLLLGDLPGQRAAVLAAPQSPEARDALHRLRAACGFCGAARLAGLVRALESASPPTPEALEQFARTVHEMLSAPRE
jgi:CheY-like chemotaxis protein